MRMFLKERSLVGKGWEVRGECVIIDRYLLLYLDGIDIVIALNIDGNVP
jgi:hypothetical protein